MPWWSWSPFFPFGNNSIIALFWDLQNALCTTWHQLLWWLALFGFCGIKLDTDHRGTETRWRISSWGVERFHSPKSNPILPHSCPAPTRLTTAKDSAKIHPHPLIPGLVSGFQRPFLSNNGSNKSYKKKLLRGQGMHNAFFYFKWQSAIGFVRLELSRIALYLECRLWSQAFWVQNLPLALVIPVCHLVSWA